MMDKVKKEEKEFPQKLLVEGNTDKHVVLALCAHYNVTQNFNVKDCDGIDNLLQRFSIMLTNPSNVKTIGVIVDADNDMKARLGQIRSIVKPHGYDIPDELQHSGLICSSSYPDYPKLGLWLMPDNIHLGMVEDFALSMASTDDALLMEAEDELQRIEESGNNRYSLIHHSKAKIHTYLAWQEEPGCPIGMSITKHVLDPNHPIAQGFVQNWLVPLFQ